MRHFFADYFAAYLNIIGRANARPITRRSVELSEALDYRKADNQ